VVWKSERRSKNMRLGVDFRCDVTEIRLLVTVMTKISISSKSFSFLKDAGASGY
jgi:hypothetical protein